MSQLEMCYAWMLLGCLYWRRDKFVSMMCWLLAGVHAVKVLEEVWK